MLSVAMTTLLLIRHAQKEFRANALAGRAPGVHLSSAGRRDAQELASRLAVLPIKAVYSSPLERALETAQAIAQRCRLEVQVAQAFNELDYGLWTGCSYDDLRRDPAWAAFNNVRSLARIPSGESAAEVAVRAVRGIEQMRQDFPDGLVAIATHADVIRTVIAHCLGVPIDLGLRIEIGLCSVSILRFEMGAPPRILMLNGLDFTRVLE
jgi:broad specificity phosphatase PhoE